MIRASRVVDDYTVLENATCKASPPALASAPRRERFYDIVAMRFQLTTAVLLVS